MKGDSFMAKRTQKVSAKGVYDEDENTITEYDKDGNEIAVINVLEQLQTFNRKTIAFSISEDEQIGI
jgi:hypothetical protein